ncbi:ejaculatory bulb-specific protein 2 [Drosophila gunungcola]|uniref:Uncharacterized protein n=1 Tax=Drosophila gunungcola TaxID=103775 RepID=A0A9Q0BIU8_9MUSC|nr:ejaculatory bulb-specific protein 2 [Drosophila elegans]XP_052843713.1 ejaculatory bulb-specific protein 2 [Drosophila gunungcola]KAI8034112.1 hypothetical protein M5D96_013071 [Drosophila gunungcola]
MTRIFILVLLLSLVTDSAFGSIDQLIRSISNAFGGGAGVGINANVPGSGFGIRTPNGQLSVGYGFGR